MTIQLNSKSTGFLAWTESVQGSHHVCSGCDWQTVLVTPLQWVSAAQPSLYLLLDPEVRGSVLYS